MTRRLKIAFGILIALLLAACRQGGQPAVEAAGIGGDLKSFYPDVRPVGNGHGFARVTYAPNVHQIQKADGLDGLIAESSDGHALIFKASTPQVAALKEGDILMIKGVAARRVLAVDRQGDQVLLAVEIASLRDLIQEGEIDLEAPIRFGNIRSGALAIPRPALSIFDQFITPVYAQSFSPENNAAAAASQRAAMGATIDGFGNMVKGLGKYMISGWTVTQYSAVPSDGRMNLDLTMTKSEGGFVALIGAHGFISNFDLVQNIHLGTQSAANQLAVAFRGLGGQMKFQWQIGKGTPGVYAKEDRIKLPVSVSVPLAQYLGGLPAALEISSALIVHPGLTGGNETASGAYTVNFGGSMMGSGEQSGASGSGDFSGTATIDEDTGVSAVAPVGMVVAYCMPRLELGLGLSKIFPFLPTKGLVGAAVGQGTSWADKWLGSLAQRNSALAGMVGQPLGIGLLSNTLKSNAAVFAQLVTSGGVTRTGVMTMAAPCSRVDLHVLGQVGMNVNLFGLKVDENKHTATVFTKAWSRSTGGLCAEIGK